MVQLEVSELVTLAHMHEYVETIICWCCCLNIFGL